MQNLTTKVGDEGTTKTFLGHTISKCDHSCEVLAHGDMLCCLIGGRGNEFQQNVQRTIQRIMGIVSMIGNQSAEINHNLVAKAIKWGMTLSESDVEYVESYADAIRNSEKLKNYSMSGWHTYGYEKSMLASKQCRLFEVHLVRLLNNRVPRSLYPDIWEEIGMSYVLKFINRLSDCLFYMGIEESL